MSRVKAGSAFPKEGKQVNRLLADDVLPREAPGYTETTYLLTEAESGYVLDGCEDGEGSPVWHDEESPLPSVEFWIPPIAAAPHVALQAHVCASCRTHGC